MSHDGDSGVPAGLSAQYELSLPSAFAEASSPRETILAAFGVLLYRYDRPHLLPLSGGDRFREVLARVQGLTSKSPDGGISEGDLVLSVSDGRDGLRARLEYDPHRFDSVTIARMAGHLNRLLEGLIADPDAPIGEAPLLTAPELHQLRVEWNGIRVDAPPRGTLHGAFEALAARVPDRVAVVFYADEGGAECARLLTYGALNELSSRLARRIKDLGIGPGDRVGLCLPRTADPLVAILGVLKAGAAYLPLDPSHPPERIAFQLKDAGATLVIVHHRLRDRLPEGTPLLSMDGPSSVLGQEPGPSLPTDATAVAYVIYTSGSTGKPKGVLISHANVRQLFEATEGLFRFEEDDVFSLFHSFAFDFSVWEMWGALLYGGEVLIVPRIVSRAPEEFHELLDRERVTVLSQTPTAFRQLSSFARTTPRPNPPALRSIVFGGEPLDAPTVGSWVEAHGDHRPQLFNLYGITETTVHVTLRRLKRQGLREETGSCIGQPISRAEVHVLDSRGQTVPIGVPGEIYVGGSGVGLGYLHRPELTAERFVPSPFANEPSARLYRSGDLARRLADGSLEYLGRIDHQVKLRGFRIELGEIASVLRQHPGVRDAVVLAREEISGDPRLVAYVAAATELTAAGLREHLRRHLPEPMVPNAFVFLPQLPLTPNGKVDRNALLVQSALPESSKGGDQPLLEERIRREFCALLGAPAGLHDDFFALGGQSVSATQLLSRIGEMFQVQLPLRSFFEAPTIHALARAVRGRQEKKIRPIESAGLGPPLSFAQEGLWLLERVTPTGAAYHIPSITRLEGLLDVEALAEAFREMARRHQVLRTSYPAVDGRPVSVVDPNLSLDLRICDLESLSISDREKEVRRRTAELVLRPFDLAEGPVARATLLRLSGREHHLVVVLHHIVADGWSLGVLNRELTELYGAFRSFPPAFLPELPLQYAEFARWQREIEIEPLLAYWKTRLNGWSLLELPCDRPRPRTATFRGHRQSLPLSSALGEALHALGRRQGVTLFMVLLAAFKVLLHRYTGQTDLLLGSPVANRPRAELEPLIGYFANMVVMRTDLSGDPDFLEVLRRVRESALGAFDHQELPFEKLVEALRPERDPGFNPLFQISFSLQNAPGVPLALHGVTAVPADAESSTSRFDLELHVSEENGILECRLVYSTDLFTRVTIQRFLAHWQAVLSGIAAEPGRRVSDLALLSAWERHQILEEWNDRATLPADRRGFHHLFEEQVGRTPDAVAVAVCDTADENGKSGQWTYRELDERANRLAAYLRQSGVGPEVAVALSLDRSFDLLVSILGILKAGGAFHPIDPAYPEARRALLMEDSESRSLRLDGHLPLIEDSPRDTSDTSGSSLAYVMYTSGSTGAPQGIGVEHRGMCNLAEWQRDVFRLGPGDRVLQFSPIGFDAFVWELCMAFCSGASLILTSWETLSSPEDLALLMRRESMTAATLSVSMLTALSEECLPLEVVVSAGEPCPGELARRWAARGRFRNAYGPTEGTVCASMHTCGGPDSEARMDRRSESQPPSAASLTSGGQPTERGARSALRGETRGGWGPGALMEAPPIGRPIANVSLYVLDSALSAVPVGVFGELFIGGAGLARGYRGRPELTGERFVPDPFRGEPGARLFRTGDRARLLADGSLELRGRIDHQVKIRGVRVEPAEVEAALRRHPTVREAVVLPQDGHLAACVVSRGGSASRKELQDHLEATLPAYLLPSAWMFLEAIPLTAHGKIDRRALLARIDATRRSDPTEAERPRSLVEQKIARIWSEVLGIEVVSVNASFFDLGGHSLTASQVVARVRDHFAVDLPLRAFFESPTIVKLAAAVERARARGDASPPIVPIPRDGPLPLSFAQQRLWFVDQLAPGNAGYNTSAAIRLLGPLEVAALRSSLSAIVNRHESLRTTIESVNGEPRQSIRPPVGCSLPRVDLGPWPDELRRLVAEQALSPFDLRTGPVFRALLLRLGRLEHVLVLTFHHVAFDGWSVGVFLGELSAHYRAQLTGNRATVPELPVQYADFAAWQREWLKGDVLEGHVSYWRERLREAPLLDLPTDYPRPPVTRFRGDAEKRLFSPELASRLNALARREGATLFITLLAAFKSLLHRYSSQDDLVVGSPVANRKRPETESLIGFFVNMLVMRTEVGGDLRFTEVLRRVRETALSAYDHQDLPFEKLVDDLKPERDLSRNPVFQVAFALQNAPSGRLDLPQLDAVIEDVEVRATRFDLELHVWEDGPGLSAVLFYSQELFARSTMKRLLGHWEALLSSIVSDPESRISGLTLLTPAERHQLLLGWNDTRYQAGGASVMEQVERQARERPDAVAVTHQDRFLTYAALDRRANQLARFLQRHGMTRGDRAAVLMERSPESVGALLGILKAGGAFLPLDSETPSSRTELLLRDARARVLIAEPNRLDRVSGFSGTRVALDASWNVVREEPEGNLGVRTGGEELAYVIYTSGSTGIPKGVALEERGLRNLVEWHLRAFAVTEQDRASQVAGASFDASVWETWPYLACGASLHIPEKDVRSVPERLRDWLVARAITVSFLPTPLAEAVLTLEWPANTPLRALLTGGDVLRSYPPGGLPFTLVNNYGPTEGTVVTTSGSVGRESLSDLSPSIARPISNMEVFILDALQQPVPIGVIGEICIGGDGLARGYLDDPNSTALGFVPHRFDDRTGARLYRTGDRGRYLSDGRIEFRGRLDRQLKVRGFRVELREVEAVLAQHPAVREAVAIARNGGRSGDGRLAAYVVPRKEYAFEEAASQELDRVSHWRDLHEEVYRQGTLGSDPELNRVGWNSSYTGQPLSEEEMRDWAVATADRILARKPRRVLEIGCGTGMLLFRIAPHCERYVAWDFSETALAHVRQVLDAGRSLPGLKLENRRAHDFGGIDEGSFDAVILNSVVQYFPSADYLHRVLEKAVEAVAPPGFLWVGDVRSLPLLEAYAASVQLRQADENLTREELGERVRRQFTEEEELALHPRFFHALRERLPAIRGSQVLLKPGRYLNEMARFRYDVLLHVGGETMSPAEVSWKDWDHERLDLPSLRRTLSDSRTEALGVRRIPNARLTAERQVLTWMRESGSPATVGAFRSTVKEDGLEPDLVASLGAELGYRVEVDWSAHEEDGAFDAVFSRNGFQGNWRESIVEPISRPLANDPIRAALARRLPSLLRAHVRDRLPEAMVPETVILLDALPLTANGKVDRRALPEPESVLSTSPRGSVAPMTPLQARLAGLWTEVLGLSRPVGLQDSFFELGGHSLLGVQLLSRVSAAFDVELPIRALFEAPTVSAMAERLARRWKTVDPSVRSMVPIQPGGSRRPFFCAAPGPGSAFPYFRLASLLGAEQPFFGLEDPRMGTGPSDLEGVEALAAYHIQGLRKVQPQGPYFLGGWCFGGLVAFEMARQLALAGERVGLLALIDCSILPPGARSPLRELAFTLEQIRSSVPLLWDNLYVRASRVRGRAPVGNGSLPSAIASYVQRKAADALYRQLRKRVDFSHITEASLARLDLPAVRQFLTTVTATARDTLRYVGKPYDGRVTLLRARSGMTVNNAELDPTLGWAAYSQEGVSVRTVAGDHVSMFTYPHVRDLARELKDCLDQAQSR